MMPILRRLEERARNEVNEATRAEILAETVCYLVRQGEHSVGADRLRDLRARYGHGGYPRVSVWLMIAEGVTGYYGELNDAARDRFVRANEVSRVAGFVDLLRLSSSWLAHIDFNRGEYDLMARHLIAAAPDCDSRRDSADCRAVLVLGDAYLYCGLYRDAAQCHELARRIAVELGDETTIAAIMYNKATLNCLRVQTNLALGISEDAPSEFLDLQVSSSEYFHRAAHHTSLQQLSEALRARQKMCAGRFDEAAQLYSEVIDSELPVSYADRKELLRSERALCLLRSGGLQAALDEVRSLVGETDCDSGLTADAKLVFWYCVDQVAKATSASDLLASSTPALATASARFQDEQAAVRSALDRVKLRPGSV